jgi:outer membrane lipoprotein-sorting protein
MLPMKLLLHAAASILPAVFPLLAGCTANPEAILNATAKAYREAATYSDNARVRVAFIRGDATTERTMPFRVVFARPDRIRIECYDARIVADGTTLLATVGAVPGQVRAEDVQTPLGLEQIVADEQVRMALAEGDAGLPTQMALLLADDTIELIRADATSPPRVVGSESLDGRPCTRIDIDKPEGRLSLWIDRDDHLLRRISLPTDAYARVVSEQSGTLTGVSVVIDFVDASFGTPLPDAVFTLSMPEGSARVARLEPTATDAASRAGTIEPPTEQVIAPRQQPVRFKLVEAWRSARIGLPGNLICFDSRPTAGEAAAPAMRIAALDGWQTVVVLDAAGRELARHELGLPKGAAVEFLRTALDREGRRWWLGGTQGARQIFVFDEAWALHATYPPRGSPEQSGISDAQLVDTDDDGSPEIVAAFSGTRGLEWASLDGSRLWPDRQLPAVVSIAPLPTEDRKIGLAAATRDGRCIVITADGAAGEPVAVTATDTEPASILVRQLFGGPVAMDQAWSLVGLASSAGTNSAVGLMPAGTVAWKLPLAPGDHRAGPIEPVAWADLLGSKRWQWLFAEPDGSVTFAWADGRVVGRSSHGRARVGLGGFRAAGVGHVVLATPDGLECLRLEDVALD